MLCEQPESAQVRGLDAFRRPRMGLPILRVAGPPHVSWPAATNNMYNALRDRDLRPRHTADRWRTRFGSTCTGSKVLSGCARTRAVGILPIFTPKSWVEPPVTIASSQPQKSKRQRVIGWHRALPPRSCASSE